MAAPAEIITDVRPSVISLRWIINGREDLIWFIGSVVSSYALLLSVHQGNRAVSSHGSTVGDTD